MTPSRTHEVTTSSMHNQVGVANFSHEDKQGGISLVISSMRASRTTYYFGSDGAICARSNQIQLTAHPRLTGSLFELIARGGRVVATARRKSDM